MMKKMNLIGVILLVLAQLPGLAQEADLLGRWSDDELLGSNIFNNVYNEIWGIVVDGNEYAVLGSTAGTHFIDLSDPSDPVQTNFVEGAVNSGVIIHRDFHDYNGYLYTVADEGASTLQIIDIRNLPASAPVVYESAALIARAHNIFIDADNALLYSLATNGLSTSRTAMRIFDLQDPENPTFIAEHNVFGGIQIGYVHDAYVRNNIAFLNCGGFGLFIVDFSDPQNPELLKAIQEYPDQGYCHSGWLSDDGNYYYMADENHAFAMKTVDVSNPCEAEVVGTFDAELTNVFAIPHNQIVACDYLYSAYYYDGLQVFDISDKENPEKVLYFDTYAGVDEQSYHGAWGVYPLLPSGIILVSDMQSGLFVLDGVGDQCHTTKEIRELSDPCSAVPTAVLESNNIKGMYPQPVMAGHMLTIEWTDRSTTLDIDLYSMDGRTAQYWKNPSGDNMSLQLKLDDALFSGMYLLRIRTATGISAQLLEIQN